MLPPIITRRGGTVILFMIIIIAPVIVVRGRTRRILVPIIGFVITGAVTRSVRELVTADTGLLLCLGLVTALDLALVEAALDADSEGIRNLRRYVCQKLDVRLDRGTGLTDWAILTTSSIPISPRVASATSVGRPKTVGRSIK